MRQVSVAVPVPGLGPLSYSLPDILLDPPVGARVLVPLGKRVLTGIVCGVEIDGAAVPNVDEGSVDLKPVVDVLDREPFLPAEIVRLAHWVSEYYACGLGDALATAMPPRAWVQSERRARITDLGEAHLLRERGARRDVLDALTGGRITSVSTLSARSRAVNDAVISLEQDGLITLAQPLRGKADASRTIRVARVTAQGTEDLAGTPLTSRQQAVLDLLRGVPDGMPVAELTSRGLDGRSVSRLVRLGLVAVERLRVERDPFDALVAPNTTSTVTLTTEQEEALERLGSLSASATYHVALLHGVTGSGKTEIYLRLARSVRESGRSVLLMVPEIALTPAVAALFRNAFGSRVAIQHSGLSDGERYDQWQRIRRGDVDVVVGTRSAVFTPLARLGLIVVDEEHDGSYKQEETPRYHGRDVAIVRAKAAGALVVLGSATPALETFHNAENGRYGLVTLKRRVLDRPMARVHIVDMREVFAAEGPDVVLSVTLRDALAARVERGEQSILLLNRRGFATAVFCRECGDTLECPNCSVSLTVHKRINRARCHYCNYSMPMPKTCRKCAGPFLEQLGYGTERVEAEVRTLLPAVRVARVDRDTVRRRGAIAALLARFAAGELDVLVGTQMIAKGHDFPRVTLVGVINADVGLGLADFRAAERTFQLLTQVAGRAGRGEMAGDAIVQTLYPRHYSIRHACDQNYPAFYAEELTFRQAMRYPPAVAMINVVVKGRSRQAAMDGAGEIAAALRTPGLESLRVLGPAPAPLGRLKGEHRAQLFLKGTQRHAMRKALSTVLDNRPDLKRRVIVDVDPLSVL